MAEDHMAYVLAGHIGASQRLAHDQCTQRGGRHVLQAATKGTNGGAHTADDNDFTLHKELRN